MKSNVIFLCKGEFGIFELSFGCKDAADEN